MVFVGCILHTCMIWILVYSLETNPYAQETAVSRGREVLHISLPPYKKLCLDQKNFGGPHGRDGTRED